MITNNFIDNFSQFYFYFKRSVKKFYQNSNFYDKKISKTKDITFEYKPSPYLLSSIIKYQKKNIKLKILHQKKFGKITLSMRNLKN